MSHLELPVAPDLPPRYLSGHSNHLAASGEIQCILEGARTIPQDCEGLFGVRVAPHDQSQEEREEFPERLVRAVPRHHTEVGC